MPGNRGPPGVRGSQGEKGSRGMQGLPGRDEGDFQEAKLIF